MSLYDSNEIIPFCRPKKLTDDEHRGILAKMSEIFTSGMLTNWENCRRLEQEIKRLYPVDYVVACSSCTQGIYLALRAFKARNVFIPSFSWKSVDYITRGLKRFWLDIDVSTWLPIRGRYIAASLTPTPVFIIQHTFGSIVEWKRKHNGRILYDAAYSIGAKIKDIGDITVFSTTATKPITSCEGGLVLTNDSKLAEEITELRDRCSRMSEIHAVIGLAYLKQLNDITKRRKQISEYYNKHLPFQPQKIPIDSTCGYHGILCRDRDSLSKRLADKIETRVRYEPLTTGLPNTTFVAERILLIPNYPDVDERRVVNIIMETIE